MAGEAGVLVEETRVQKLANEAVRLHQQLLGLLAQRGFETTPSFPAPFSTKHPANIQEVVPWKQATERYEARDDITSTNAASDVCALGGGTQSVQEVETPEAILSKVLRQGEELIGSFALTKGQESSREYKNAKEELLSERKGVLKGVAVKLHGAERAMEDVLDKHSLYKRPKFVTEVGEQLEDKQKHVTVADIISYAHKISYSTFAPPSFVLNQELPPGFQPPAPQAEHMRASALYQFSEEELGMKLVSTSAPLPIQAPEPSPASLPQPPPGWKPGMPVELPPMPPGWKPGMELPLPPLALPNLPPMPPGWKPGDPIPLPTGPPQMPPPGIVAPRQKAQPIQVAHVDLDLNPDLEGDFYSSDSDDDEDDSDSEDE